MRIISWNVAGLRARLKNNNESTNHLMKAIFNQINSNDLGYKYYDIARAKFERFIKYQF